MAALIFSVIYLTENWADRVKAAVRKALGQAERLVSTIRIGGAEYIPFDNLVDVLGKIDMEPTEPDGTRWGALPAGARIVCMPNGRVTIALPVDVVLGEISMPAPTATLSVDVVDKTDD
ncbi:MAG: hypothetical protein OXC99_02930 [Chloroflexi bacterium]|nr:hypothetical protein [Chloroflexota bacterium]